MKLRPIAGMVAGLLSLGLVAASAHAAGPADVTVRVEGAARTLAGGPVRTTTKPVVKDGNASHACTGTSAAGALETATGGDWTATWFDGLGYSVDSVKGESHTFATDEYWTLWINDAASSVGLCDAELQQGDDVLIFPQCGSCRTGRGPLDLSIPSAVRAGRPFTVGVVEHTVTTDASFNTTYGKRPSAGATVTVGGTSYTTDAAGHATVTLARPEPIQASKPGYVRTEVLTPCLTQGPDGTCGTRDKRSPRAVIRIRDGRRFAPGHPRLLRGTVASDPSGLSSVQLRLKRRVGHHCSVYDGSAERFRRSRCGHNAKYFTVGDREAWSYLLPARLKRGRYTFDVVATDKAGNKGSLRRGTSRVVFFVR
jgi:Bacterial Ig-like domain